jgi:hypothetical protein
MKGFEAPKQSSGDNVSEEEKVLSDTESIKEKTYEDIGDDPEYRKLEELILKKTNLDSEVKENFQAFDKVKTRETLHGYIDFVYSYPDKAKQYADRWLDFIKNYPDAENNFEDFVKHSDYDHNDLLAYKRIATALERVNDNEQERLESIKKEEIEKEKTLSDSRLVKAGAEYRVDDEGNKSLEVADGQVEKVKEDSLEESGLSIGGTKSEKEDDREVSKERLTDYPDYLYERINENQKGMESAETLSDLSDYFRNLANRIEADRNTNNYEENHWNKKVMLAHHIREAINTEIGLIEKSPEERLKGINLLIEQFIRFQAYNQNLKDSKEFHLKLLNSDVSQEEKNNVENNIVRHESMIKFLNDRKDGIERNLK